MKLCVVAYKDTKLGVFAQPIYVPNQSDEEIIETFRRMCANPGIPSTFFEYDVYKLGFFDDKTGCFNASEPEFLVSLGDYKYLATKQEVKEDVKAS